MPGNYIDFTPEKDALKEKVILVTGAGEGIGRALSIRYAQLGATVLLLGRTEAKLASVYDEIIADKGLEPAIIPLNLEYAKQEDYLALAQQIDTHFGKIDGLVHSAGMLGELTLLEQYPYDLWQQVLQTNLTAPFILTQSLFSLLNKAQNASVIFMTSSVGRVGRAHWGAYCVSKFGIEGLAQTWAEELTQTSNIRMNAVNPGATRTLMRARAFPFENPTTLKTPEQISGVFTYLMCNESVDVTGQSFDAQLPKTNLS